MTTGLKKRSSVTATSITTENCVLPHYCFAALKNTLAIKLPITRANVPRPVNITHLVKPSNYYPLLVFHIGNEEVGKRSYWVIKRDFRALERLLKGSGEQAVFSFVLSGGDWDPHKRRKVDMLNEWLCKWLAGL